MTQPEKTRTIPINHDDLVTLNDRLADVLCHMQGFKAGIHANVGGNQEQRRALLRHCEYVEENLIDSKRTVKRLISLSE